MFQMARAQYSNTSCKAVLFCQRRKDLPSFASRVDVLIQKVVNK